MGDGDQRHDPPVYVGESRFIRYLPIATSPGACVALLRGDAVMFLAIVVPALLVAAWLPWRFEVDVDGVLLNFGLGRYRFFERETVAVRAGLGGATLFPGRNARIGYPLTSGLIERDRTELRRLMLMLGFHVVD